MDLLAFIYLAFTLLYLHAWRLRDVLGLSEIEKLETRFVIYRLLPVVAVGFVVAGLALLPLFPSWAGLIYFLLVPIMRGLRMMHRRRRAALQPVTCCDPSLG